ncbi:MAG: RHS repeat-associated core domain-containing protein [Nitrospirales bacterium]
MSSGSTSYFHPDHLGSTSVLTTSSGVKEQDLVYYPYGETYTNTGTELDDSTGLYFYEARYYDAVLGRFISADIIVPNATDPQTFNRYTYGNNNPILYNDPTGHFGFKSIKKRLKKASNFIEKKLGPVGSVIAGVTLQFNPQFIALTGGISSIAGTAHLTQSKEGRYVLAGEIIVATAVATYYCGGCGAAPYLQGALAGELSLGTTGGLSAARNGGDISKGVLFGTVTGAVVGGLSGGTLAKFNVINPATGVVNLPSLGTFDTFVTGTTVSGAFLGAGKGATESYAGGRGSLASIIRGASGTALREAAFAPFTNLGSGFISEKIFGGLGNTDFSFTFDTNIPIEVAPCRYDKPTPENSTYELSA